MGDHMNKLHRNKSNPVIVKECFQSYDDTSDHNEQEVERVSRFVNISKK